MPSDRAALEKLTSLRVAAWHAQQSCPKCCRPSPLIWLEIVTLCALLYFQLPGSPAWTMLQTLLTLYLPVLYLMPPSRPAGYLL